MRDARAVLDLDAVRGRETNGLQPSRFRRLPWITVSVATAGLLASAIPGAGELLQYDRGAVESGAFWRPLSGQLTHWTPRMAAADLLVLLTCGAWLEYRSRRLVSWTILAAAITVGLAVHAWTLHLSFYRGSSGIATALFAAGAFDIFKSHTAHYVRRLALTCLLLLGAKIAWEAIVGRALFAGSLPPGVTVVPAVHLVGALVGIVCLILVRPRTSAGAEESRVSTL